MAKFWKEYEVHCPSCLDHSVVKAGQRNGYQRYRCKACRHHFRADGQAKRRKNVYTAEMIGATIRDYYAGLSIKQLTESIADRYDVPEPSKATICRWISAYTDQACHELQDIKANTGAHLVIDELFVRVGGVQGYTWIVMDKDSRYILAAHLSLDRDGKSAIQALLKALKVAKRPPTKITTDKAKAYPIALDKVLPGAKHIKSEGVESWLNNNMIERLNGTYRSREKTLRGLDSWKSGQHYIDGFTIYYNFFRDHHALKGKRPAQVAGVGVPYKEWADFARADIEVPASCRKKVVKRGTPKFPVEYIERARAEAEKKRKKRKGKGRVRSPKPVPEEYKTPDRQMRLAPPPELDEVTKAKLKPSAVMPPTPTEEQQFKLDISKTGGKVAAPKPKLPELASNLKKGNQPLIPLNSVPRFMRPKPSGSKRH